MKRIVRVLMMGVFAAIFMAVMFSLSFAQTPAQQKSKGPTPPVQPVMPVKQELRPGTGLPPLPDLIIAGPVRLDRPPFFGFSGRWRMQAVIVPIRFRIENRGNADAGSFRITIKQQSISSPGAETEAKVEGETRISGLRPTRLYPTEGVGFYNLLWNVAFPKSMAGQRFRIKAIIDSGNEVREAPPAGETDNVSPWLEVQLPVERR